MKRDQINTRKAPKAIGPYSQGIRKDDLVFLSMQVGIDPITQQLVKGGVQPQVKQVFKNISEILIQAGSQMNNVVKSTVFITDMKNFSSVNELYAQYFDPPYPARSVVEVGNLPLGAEIAVEIIAVCN